MTVLAVSPPVDTGRYRMVIATNDEQVRAAQRLRYQVFAEELGAALPSTTPGLDIDEFDAHCDPLLVVDEAAGEGSGSRSFAKRGRPFGAVVGTYRMLPP